MDGPPLGDDGFNMGVQDNNFKAFGDPNTMISE